MMPPPFGTWGLPEKELRSLPGYRDPARDRAEAKKLLAQAGYGDPSRLPVTVKILLEGLLRQVEAGRANETSLRALTTPATTSSRASSPPASAWTRMP